MSWIDYANEHGLLFESLISLNKYKTVVEVGTAYAATTKFLCAGAQKTGGHVHCFDLWATHGLNDQFHAFSSKEECQRYLTSEEFDNFTLTQMDSTSQEFRNAIEALPTIDFAFIDGCHSYDGVLNDFSVIYPKLSEVGTIVFHDTLRIDGCREFMIDLRTKFFDGTFDVIDIPHGNGDRRCGISILAKRTFPIVDMPCDEICNLENRLEEIYQKEQDWFSKEVETYHTNIVPVIAPKPPRPKKYLTFNTL